MQAYTAEVPYRLGPEHTAHIYSLSVHNTTLVPEPEHVRRRFDELYVMTYVTYVPAGCDLSQQEGVPCDAWRTHAVYDWKWYSQTMVRGLAAHVSLHAAGTLAPCMRP